MMKRSKLRRMIAIVLTLCMIVSMAVVGSFQASAAIIKSSDGLWGYTVYYDDLAFRQMVCIGNYYGTETSISLPTEIDGYIPNEVGLIYAPTLKNIHIPKNYILCSGISDTIETVTFDRDYTEAYVELQYHGFSAFDSCKNLKKVVLPNLISDEKYTEVKTEIVDGKQTYLPDYYYGKLPEQLFKNCKKLEEVVFPDNVDFIASECFYNCKSLKTLTIPEGVRKIGDGAFQGCSNLKFISFPTSLENCYFIGAFHKTSENIIVSAPANSYAGQYVQTDEKYSLINSDPTDINGDVNGDNTLSINDVTLMQKRLVKIYPFELNNYDVNGDGKFNIWDATEAQRQIAKIAE